MKKSKLKFIKRYVEVKRGHQLIHEGLQVPLELSREQYLHITHACQHVHTYTYMHTQNIDTQPMSDIHTWGVGGSLVESTPFVRRVMGSTPALTATWEPWASPSLTVANGAPA